MNTHKGATGSGNRQDQTFSWFGLVCFALMARATLNPGYFVRPVVFYLMNFSVEIDIAG